MKKSRIILPALGVLILSSAAAVTGTVAWFTASRIASISASAITAYNPESGLKVTLANVNSAALDGASIGTAVGAGDTAATVTHSNIRDGSVDLANGRVYGSNLGEDGELDGTTPYKLIRDGDTGTADLKAGTAGSTDYYYANVYKATFALDADKAGNSYALM